MGFIDFLQKIVVEIVGLILFLIISGLLIVDLLILKEFTFPIYAYVILYILSLGFMGFRALAFLFMKLIGKK